MPKKVQQHQTYKTTIIKKTPTGRPRGRPRTKPLPISHKLFSQNHYEESTTEIDKPMVADYCPQEEAIQQVDELLQNQYQKCLSLWGFTVNQPHFQFVQQQELHRAELMEQSYLDQDLIH